MFELSNNLSRMTAVIERKALTWLPMQHSKIDMTHETNEIPKPGSKEK